MEFRFSAPTKLIFGEGTFGQLGQAAVPYGKRVLIVTSRRARYADKAVELLAASQISAEVFAGIPANPDTDSVDAGAEAARKAGCDLVIGLGGGSSMDAAKAIAIGAAHEVPIRRFMADDEGERLTPGAATLPVICVSTTAGTSSELTPFAVLTLMDRTQKSAIRSEFIQARVAICDPVLTYSMPAKDTAATGIDVLCHALESYVSNSATPVTDLMSQEAIRLVGRYLPVACGDLGDVEARRQMMLANTFAGFGLACCGATVMHGMEHPISAHYPQIAHGAGLAALLRPWARKMKHRQPQKLGRVVHLLEERTLALTVEAAADKAEEVLGDLLERVGMDQPLATLGVEAEKVLEMAQDACRYMGVTLEKTPGGMVCEDLVEMLGEAL